LEGKRRKEEEKKKRRGKRRGAGLDVAFHLFYIFPVLKSPRFHEKGGKEGGEKREKGGKEGKKEAMSSRSLILFFSLQLPAEGRKKKKEV